jgi:hypothetical protein
MAVIAIVVVGCSSEEPAAEPVVQEVTRVVTEVTTEQVEVTRVVTEEVMVEVTAEAAEAAAPITYERSKTLHHRHRLGPAVELEPGHELELFDGHHRPAV